jgi:glycosyl transferase family 25
MNSSPLQLQILVISLERSLDRRAQVEREMKKISLPWNFLNAVDGAALKDVPIEYNSRKVKRLLGYELTPSEIGCYLSHKSAWKACVENNMTTLVLEDDFVLSSDFERILHVLLSDITAWNVIRLQGLYEVPFNTIVEKSGIALVKNQGDAVGCTAYLLKPEMAKVLIKHSTSIYEPVDHFMEHHLKHGVEFLAIRPYPVGISLAKSTIADRSERAPVKGLMKRYRSIARVIDRLFSNEPWFPKS